MATFAVEITIIPIVSQPTTFPYQARGIWASKPVDVQLEDGSILSSQTYTLGIRLSEFAVPVVQGDHLIISGVEYAVDDTDDDGQGGTVLTLKAVVKPE
jgi:hypothetical protein